MLDFRYRLCYNTSRVFRGPIWQPALCARNGRSLKGRFAMTIVNSLRVFISKITGRKSCVHSSWASEDVTSFFTGVLAPCVEKRNGKDTLCFLIIPSYNPKRYTLQHKAPGGDDNQDYEFQAECAVREIGEEVMKEYSKVSLSAGLVKLLYFVDVPDEKFSCGGESGIHRKSFWMLPLRLFENFSNAKRHFRSVNIFDGEDELRPPELTDVSELASGKMYKTHLHALALAIVQLAEIDVVYDLLPDGLLEWARLPEHVVRGQPIYYVPPKS